MTQTYEQPAVADIYQRSYTLAKPIAAIHASLPDALPFGPVVQLPRHVTLTVLGDGFHDTLVKVRCDNAIYFVFRADLINSDVSH